MSEGSSDDVSVDYELKEIVAGIKILLWRTFHICSVDSIPQLVKGAVV